MSGNQVDRRPATLLVTYFAENIGRHMACIIASMLFVAFWTVAALAVDAPISAPVDDVELTKALISLLAAGDIAAVRDRLNPTAIQISDDTLHQMSNAIGISEPRSIETISLTGGHNLQTGDGSSRILLEYGLADKWVVVDAVVTTKAASKRFDRLYLIINSLPLRELNAFHLFGKGPVQYLFLAGWIVVIALTSWAVTVAFRRHRGWRRWALMVLMPLGLTPTVAVNWNTAQLWVLEAVSNQAGYVIPFFAVRYPMALVGYTETRVPYLFISAPLIAFGYLIWHWRRSRQLQQIPVPTDQGY